MRVVIVSKTFVAEPAQRQLEWIARQPEIDLTLVAPGCWSGSHRNGGAEVGRRLP